MAIYEIETDNGTYEVEVEDQASSGGESPAFPAMDIAKQAVSEAFMQPGTNMRALATDPVTQAKALPILTGIIGGASPIPGGATLGTVGGRQLSNAALRAYGRPEEIPSAGTQIMEGALAAAGDIVAIPMAKRSFYGNQIGKAETAAGVVTRAPEKLPAAGSVGEYMTNLEAQLDSGAMGSAQAARDAVAGMRYINGNPNIVGKSSDIAVQAARVSAKAQDYLNKVVPGRAVPAQAMGQAMTIPNAIGRQWNKIPPMVRRGIIPLGIMEEYLRRRHGG